MIISFLLGTLLEPLPGKIEDMIIKNYFQGSEARAVFIDKIRTTINLIANAADRVNLHTEYYRKKVCEQVYHKSYAGVPCYTGPIDGAPNKKIAGELFINKISEYIDIYQHNIQVLQNTLDEKSTSEPTFIPILNRFNKWLVAIRNNCWFPRNEYYNWENIILHQIDSKMPFDAKDNDDKIQHAVDLGLGGFPSNCSRYLVQSK